jgi:Kef-type K+ transport system membrane component KefB
MRTVLLYSLLLVAGLIGSQVLPSAARDAVELLAMFCLAFIMIHVGYEFDVDKEQPRQYLVDYGVAATAAAFPWMLTALYFVFAMAPREMWGSIDLWKEALLQGRFAAPTSTGVLFSMLAAAGLGATWVFGKAHIACSSSTISTRSCS